MGQVNRQMENYHQNTKIMYFNTIVFQIFPIFISLETFFSTFTLQ